MKKLHKLFLETNMTWRRVILLAILSAVVSAAVLLLPVIRNTSLTNIGVSFEAWVVLAIYIIMNCKSWYEAGFKTFVFFLISQPLIYLFQVPFSPMGWDLFQYYPYWFKLTLLCLPGGMIAWFVKKDTVLSALILSVATSILACLGVYYLQSCLFAFPRNLLSVIFCFASAVLLIAVLLRRKKNRWIAGVVTGIAAAAMCAYLMLNPTGTVINTDYDLEPGTVWTIEENTGEIASVWMDDADTICISAVRRGTQQVKLHGEDGRTLVLVIEYDGRGSLSIGRQ